MCKKIILAVFLFFASYMAKAQSVAINTDGSTANPSALLDIKSTGKGVLVPRMSKTQKNAIVTPATGLLIFQDAPDSIGFYYYNGTAWLWLATANNMNNWSITGNTGTDTAVNFIGTTDNMPIRFKQNNSWIGQLNSNTGNFFIGTNSGKNSTAATNTAYGANSLVSNNIGIGNLAMGAAAMSFNTSASRNTAVGDSAMITQSFSNGNAIYFTDNTAIGSKALFFNQPTTAANGYKNTAIGSEALYLNTTGFENTAVGTGAMHDNITGEQNTAVGRSAHRLSKSGNLNTYIGFEAGYNDSTSNNNVGVGYRALKNSSNGQNTALGSGALGLNTIGGSNVGVGYISLSSNTTGALNTAVGMNSMFTNITGSNNVTVGALANVTTSNLTNAVAIGSRATVAQSNALVLGSINGINGAVATANVGIGTNAPNASSSLDITSTSRGILIPRMSKAQKNAIVTPATGLMVFQNAPDSVGFYYYNGSTWLWMATATNVSGWATNGNAGTDTAVNFIGTTTDMPLRFKVNNQWNGQFEPNNSNYFIGINAGRFNTGIVNTAFGSFGLANNTSGSFNTAFGGGAMISNTTGSSNVAMGNTTLANHKFGDNNVAVGTNAMNADTASSDNVAIGAFAMINGKKSNSNTAVGYSSLAYAGLNSTNALEGNFNTALGYNSGGAITKGFGNVAVGNTALSQDSIGTANTAIGNGAAGSFIGGSSNIAIGYFAMNNAKGSTKVAIGHGVLGSDTAATGNTAIGSFAMTFNRRGVNNVAVGISALYNNISGSRNVAIGDSALKNQNFALGNGVNHFTNNTAVGYRALFANQPTSSTDGINNTAIGSLALTTNTSGFDNTAVGTLALNLNTNGSSNVAIGANALEKGRGGFNHFNVAVGVQALRNDSTSFGANTAIGFQAGLNNSGGSDNYYGGFVAARSMTSGSNNTVIGSEAMQNHSSGDSNVVIGSRAMGTTVAPLKNGNYNTAVGFEALFFNDTSSNTAIGYRALRSVSTGANNTSLGLNSGNNLTTGFNNTFLGAQSQALFTSVSNATAIGYQSAVTQNNSLVLGSINGINGASATVNVGVGTITPAARMHIVRNGIGGGTYHPESGLILENSSIFTLQFSTPNSSAALIRSGNAATDQRSGITFEADSSINFNSGGSLNRMIIDNTGFVGVRNSAPASLFDVAGSVANGISTSTSSTTLDQLDHTHIILPTVSAVVITLPAASACARREYTIVNEDNSVQAISSYIDFTGAANITLLANSSITIQSNGTNWYRIR